MIEGQELYKEKKDMGEKRDDDQEVERIIWDCGSPLYDSYEIASLGNLIERKMMALSWSPPCGSNRFAIQSRDGYKQQLRADEGLESKNVEAHQTVGFFSKFVERISLWNNRKIVAEHQERNKKAKKLRRMIYRFCRSIVSSMQKKKLQI